MRPYLSDETNIVGRGGEQEMRDGKRGRMNLNLRTSVVSLSRRADGAICRDVSSLPRLLLSSRPHSARVSLGRGRSNGATQSRAAP